MSRRGAMTMKFATLRIWHEGCWMLETSERHPDVCVESRSVSAHGKTVHADAMLRSPNQRSLEAALAREVPDDVRIDVLQVGDGYAEVYSTYPTYRSLYEVSVDSGFLLVGPVRHEGGHEHWEVLADSATIAQGIAKLREVADVRVERVSDKKAPPLQPSSARFLGSIAADLSDRQVDILQKAVASGYYNWPRGKNVKRLAAELGISGPTCLEHIRRAESRVVPAVMREIFRQRSILRD